MNTNRGSVAENVSFASLLSNKRRFAPACVLAVFNAVGIVSAGHAQTAPVEPLPSPDAPALAANPEDEISTDGTAKTAASAELDEIFSPHTATVDTMGLESPLDYLVKQSQALESATGLRLGFAYTMIYQQATNGPGTRDGTSGDIDFISDWTLIGRGTADTGRLVATAEHRFKVGTQPASRVGPETGTLTNTTGGFNDRGWAVRDVFWAQRMFDNRFRFQLGRFDISDNVGAYRMQNINASFSNRAFSALATANFPAHGDGALLTIQPCDTFYATAGATNAYGDSTNWTTSELFDEFDMFYTAEAGYTPTIESLGRGRYALMLWHVDELKDDRAPDDQGFAVIAEQDLGEVLYGFARYQYADEAVQNINYSVQTGLGINGLLGSPDNLTGAAFSYADPATRGLRDEKVVEVFHRWQLTRYTQFSVGGQAIFDPSNAPDDDAIGVLTLRLRIAF